MKLSLLNKTFGASVFCALFCFSSLAQAGGALMVTPNRVDLNEKTTTKEVRLVNRSNETTSYRISFQNLRMNKDGSYEEITSETKGNEKFADKFVKFSPKRVTLKPGEVQTVRLMVKKPSEAGEYRSHLLFKEEAPADFGNSVEEKAGDGKKISVVLKPIFAVSIPVIVRNGELASKVNINNVEIKTDPKTKAKSAVVHLDRMGDASAYGIVTISLTPKGSSTKQEIGSIGNVAVYYPYDTRVLTIPLDLQKGVKLDGGVIEAKFYSKKEENVDQERGSVLAQKSVTLN